MPRSCLESGAVAAFAVLSACAPAHAHPTISASALVRIDASRRVVVMVSYDALAFALDDTPRNISDAAMYELLDGPDQVLTETLAAARERFAALFELLADGRRL